jgi:integrase
MAYRHGLRASEIADLEWCQVEFSRAPVLHVRRAKNERPGVHPLRGDEVRALRQLRRQSPDSAFVFATERGGPFTPDAINRLIKRIGERAGFRLPGPRSHAAARLWLRPGQRRTRHAAHPGLARPSVDRAHDQIHATERGSVQGLLEVANKQTPPGLRTKFKLRANLKPQTPCLRSRVTGKVT